MGERVCHCQLPTVKEQISPVECVAIGKEIHKILWHAFHTTNNAMHTIHHLMLLARALSFEQGAQILLALLKLFQTNSRKRNEHLKRGESNIP